MFYRIPINFNCFIGLKSVNEAMRDFGVWGKNEGSGMEQIMTMTITLPEIPNDEQLEFFAKTLMDSYNEHMTELEMLKCNFESYGKISQVPLSTDDTAITDGDSNS